LLNAIPSTDRGGQDMRASVRLLFFLTCVLLAIAQLRPLLAQSVKYIYDDAGRLVVVIDQNGDAAVYTYDAVGNLLSITHQNTGTVSIVTFSPGSGPIGSVVTIYGTGFSTTPSQNLLTFNGTSATVTASTSTSLTATVPTGATTGALAVTTPAGSGTSATNFQITTATAALISSFTPAGALAGSAVSISGANFEPLAASNRLILNTTRAFTTASTGSTVTMQVPVKAGSGRIVLSTVNGMAVSAADLFIPPSPYDVSDVQWTGRTTVGQQAAVAITTGTKIGLLVVDAPAGHRISVKVVPGPAGSAALYRPDGVLMNSIGVGGLTTLIEPQAAPVTGTYTVKIDPATTSTGTTTVTPYDVPTDVTGTIVAGGSSVTTTMNTPGQNAFLTFSGISGHRMSVAISSGVGATISLLEPTGATVASATSGSISAFIEPTTLTATDTHGLKVDSTAANTGSLTLNLYDVPADTTGTVTVGGSAASVSLGTPGQKGTLTFSGTASQQVTVRVTNNTMGTVTVKLQKADGTVLKSSSSILGSFNLATQTLPETGTYTIVIDPSKAGTGSMNVAVTNP
jgi:YD repeat-containing protein